MCTFDYIGYLFVGPKTAFTVAGWTVLSVRLPHIIMPCWWQWGACTNNRNANGLPPAQRHQANSERFCRQTHSAQRTVAKEIYCTANTRCLSLARPGHTAQLIYQPQITATIREHRTSNMVNLNSWSILVECAHICTHAHMHTIVLADYIVV